MIRSFLVFGIALFAALTTSIVSAALDAVTGTNSTATGNTASSPSALPLLLSSVEVPGIESVSLTFNQNIRIESIRARIVDQSSGGSVRIASITGSLSNSAIVVINTATPLIPGAAYVLTVTSALSENDTTIKAGVDSIREFSVPLSLKDISLNAPANPGAAMVTTGSTTPTPQKSATPTKPTTQSGSETVKPQDIPALPVTGASTTALIILAAVSALGLLLLRKRA